MYILCDMYSKDKFLIKIHKKNVWFYKNWQLLSRLLMLHYVIVRRRNSVTD